MVRECGKNTSDRLARSSRSSTHFQGGRGTGRTLNRTALGDAAGVLSRLSRSLEDEWNQLLTEFAVPDAKTQLTRSASELAAWFSEEAKAVHRESEALAAMITALSADKDVLPSEMRNRAICIKDLVTARSQIAAAAKVLNDSRPLDAIEAADHSANAALAKHLHDILEGLKRPVTPAVAAAFRDQAVREKLSATLRQSEAARRPFDKSGVASRPTCSTPTWKCRPTSSFPNLTLPDLRVWAAARAKMHPASPSGRDWRKWNKMQFHSAFPRFSRRSKRVRFRLRRPPTRFELASSDCGSTLSTNRFPLSRPSRRTHTID